MPRPEPDENGKLPGGVTGNGFKKGATGNPRGRPRGLARKTRELVGSDGEPLVEFWMKVMDDPTWKGSERIEASRLLAERGWGKPAGFALMDEEDPLGLNEEELGAVVERFDAEVVRLAAVRDPEQADPGNGAAGEPHA